MAASVLALMLAGPAAADSTAPAPPSPIIVAMAQHLVQQQFMSGSLGHYHIEFDVAYLRPQPEPGFWAVVGGFVSDQTTENSYVAAVRLICADYLNVLCWRLEKLTINGDVVVDGGERI